MDYRIKTFYVLQYYSKLQHLYMRNSALGRSCWVKASEKHDCYFLTDDTFD